MRKKIVVSAMIGLLIVVGAGCSKKETAQNTPPPVTQQQLPQGHPSIDGANTGDKPAAGKPVDVKEVENKITKALDEKYAGEWQVSGTTLKKGAYTENDNYGIVDAVAGIYPNSMVSIYVNQTRISSNVANTDANGKRVLSADFPTPAAVAETIKSGKASVTSAGSLGSSSYQKVFLPLKSGNQTVGVMSVSIPQ